VGAATHSLGWLSEGAQKGSAHPLPIGKPGLDGDDPDGQAALLEHQARGFHAQLLDRLGG